MMKGYFARKPENIEIVKGTVGEARRAGFKVCCFLRGYAAILGFP